MSTSYTIPTRLELLLEEPSAKAALDHLIPKILPNAANFAIGTRTFNGKLDLLNKLPERLRAYSKQAHIDWRILVLIDEDRQNCKMLKLQLEKIAHDAGFYSKTSPDNRGRFSLVNRLAIEELEAWFFGDVPAIVAAYPKINPNLAAKRPYRVPDAIAGGTWEALERELQEKGYHQGGLEKIKAAND